MTDQKGHLNSDGVFIKEGDSKEPLVAENWTFALEEDSPTLEKAQAHVGGFVEVLHCGEAQVLINDGGRFHGLSQGMFHDDLPLNKEATNMALEAKYHVPTKGIVGNAIILKGKARWE